MYHPLGRHNVFGSTCFYSRIGIAARPNNIAKFTFDKTDACNAYGRSRNLPIFLFSNGNNGESRKLSRFIEVII